MQELLSALEKQLNQLASGLRALEESLRALGSALRALEEQLRALESRLRPLESSLRPLEPRLRAAQRLFEQVQPRFMQAEKLFDRVRPLPSRAGSRFFCPKERALAPQRRFHPDGSQVMGSGRVFPEAKSPPHCKMWREGEGAARLRQGRDQ